MNPSLTVSQVQRPLIDYTITRPSQTASPDAKEGRSSSVSQDWTPEERKQFEKEAEFLSDLGAGATALKRLHLHYDHEKAAKTEQAIIVDKAHPKHMPPPAPKKNVFVQTGALTAREYRNRLRLWPVVAARFIISAIQVTFSAITFASCARDLVKASQPGANGGDSVPMTTAQQFGQQIILVQQSVAQVAFSIFMSAGFQMIFLLPQERAVFLREYTSNYYGINAYLTAKLTWEVPQIVLHSLIVLTIPYFAYGMNSPYYFIFPLLVLFGITGSTLGLLLVSINPDSGELPILLGPLVMATLPNIFSSIFKPLPQVWAGRDSQDGQE